MSVIRMWVLLCDGEGEGWPCDSEISGAYIVSRRHLMDEARAQGWWVRNATTGWACCQDHDTRRPSRRGTNARDP